MNRLPIFLLAGTIFSTMASAMAAQDDALIKHAERASVEQRTQTTPASCIGTSTLDHGPRATTTPWVLAQRKAACAAASAASRNLPLAG